MQKPWNELTAHQKADALRADLARLSDFAAELTSDLDATWKAASEAAAFVKDVPELKALQSEVRKLIKDVATMKSVWPRSYSKAS